MDNKEIEKWLTEQKGAEEIIKYTLDVLSVLSESSHTIETKKMIIRAYDALNALSEGYKHYLELSKSKHCPFCGEGVFLSSLDMAHHLIYEHPKVIHEYPKEKHFKNLQAEREGYDLFNKYSRKNVCIRLKQGKWKNWDFIKMIFSDTFSTFLEYFKN